PKLTRKYAPISANIPYHPSSSVSPDNFIVILLSYDDTIFDRLIYNRYFHVYFPPFVLLSVANMSGIARRKRVPSNTRGSFNIMRMLSTFRGTFIPQSAP